MRHALALAAAAAAIAIVLVLVLGDDETTEDVATVAPAPTTGEQPPSDTSPAPRPDERVSGDVAQIERAVALYIEAVERGRYPARGLPTSDELTILDVREQGDRAIVRLAGGARLAMRRVGDSWRVAVVQEGGTAVPTPPSNG